jgi:hypothetical protein
MSRSKRTPAGTFYSIKDDSVQIEGTGPQHKILDAAAKAYAATPQPLIVTSANDGDHMKGSLHYEDKALDLRVWHLSDPGRVASRIQDLLGDEYDVIAEGTHIHAEYDPA